MLLQEKYSKQLVNILDALKHLSDSNFCELDQDNFDYQLVDDFKSIYNGSFKSACGASKGVLIFKEFGFVIKIPFSECDGYEMYGAYECEEDEKWNYCEQEAIRYYKAEQANVHQVFLKTELIKDFDMYPIYIQEIAESLDSLEESDSRSSHSDDDEKFVRNCSDIANIGWQADVYAVYGKDYFLKFLDFVEDLGINDLRNANIGYIGMKPIIFDYAGFYE